MLANDRLENWDRQHFFHPSTHMASHARGDTPARVITGGAQVVSLTLTSTYRLTCDGLGGASEFVDVTVVVGGTPATIINCRHYHGMSVGGDAISTAWAYAGDGTGDPPVGQAGAAANEVDHDNHHHPINLDHGVPPDSLYVVVTGGVNCYAMVYTSQ